jgi:hypothetical protein
MQSPKKEKRKKEEEEEEVVNMIENVKPFQH